VGGKIATSHPVRSISLSGKGVEVLSNEKLSCQNFLFTGSARAFSRLLKNSDLPLITKYQAEVDRIHYLNAACLVFSTNQILFNSYWVNVNEQSAPFLVCIRHTAFIPQERYDGRQIYYIGAYIEPGSNRDICPDELLTQTWFDYLRYMCPLFEQKNVLNTHLFRFKDAQHVVDLDYRSKIPPYMTPVKGLWLSNFSQIFPEDRGTNYAVREGRKVIDLMFDEFN
jgi:protoporphyrinogen oxidase